MEVFFGTPEDFSSGAAVFRQFESLADAIIQGQSRFGGQVTTEFLFLINILGGFSLFSTLSSQVFVLTHYS